MALTFQQIQVFRAVALSGSFSSAKRVTGLSQPAVSQSIAKLEKFLNTTLFIRRRNNLELTPSGEFWFNESRDILSKLNSSISKHEQYFSTNKPIMRFGITPSLRGNLSKIAAQVVTENNNFSRFDLIIAVDGSELIDLLLMHKLNAAIVNDQSVLGYEKNFYITKLFTEEFVWAVPKYVPKNILEQIIDNKNIESAINCLKKFVDVRQETNIKHFVFQASTEGWYREHIPSAVPFYRTTSYRVAIDFVEQGLATCHCPRSLISGLSKQKIDSINWIKIGGIQRSAVLVMPKHLRSISQFKSFCNSITKFAQENFSNEDDENNFFCNLKN